MAELKKVMKAVSETSKDFGSFAESILETARNNLGELVSPLEIRPRDILLESDTPEIVHEVIMRNEGRWTSILVYVMGNPEPHAFSQNSNVLRQVNEEDSE